MSDLHKMCLFLRVKVFTWTGKCLLITSDVSYGMLAYVLNAVRIEWKQKIHYKIHYKIIYLFKVGILSDIMLL